MTALLDDLQRHYVARTPHMREIGLRITALDTDRGAMSLPARPEWVGDPARGLLHTGALTVLADSACGLAVGAAMAQPVPYATLDLRMDWLRPASPDHDVHCQAHCYRISRSVAFVRGELWQRDPALPVASVQATFMLATPAGSRRASQLTEAAPAGATGNWQPPAGSVPVLPGRPIPYIEFLGIRAATSGEATGSEVPGSEVPGRDLPASAPPMWRLPYQAKLIGNPHLPALHGGVVAGFAETAALLHLVRTLGGAKLPKGIDFSIDYLRAGRPQETFAQCELVRVGARVALVQVRCWQTAPDRPIVVARGHFLLTDAQAQAQA